MNGTLPSGHILCYRRGIEVERAAVFVTVYVFTCEEIAIQY